MKDKIVIFDFDGVLVNTIQFWFELQKEANEGFTWENFEEMNHGNFIESQSTLLKSGKYVFPESSTLRYNDALHTEFSIQDLVHSTILELANKYKLAICSSGSSSTIEKFLVKEHVREYFSDILGFESHTSKSVKLKSLIEKYGLLSNDVVFVTDTLGDISEANHVGIKSIGVTWGMHKKETLERGNPFIVIDNPSDLVIKIEDVLK